MATETILGDSTAYDSSGSSVLVMQAGALYVLEGTATWSGAASSVNCTTGKARLSEWDASGNQKMVIFNSSGTILGVSGAVACDPAWQTPQLFTFTFSPAVTINKSTAYKVGIIGSASLLLMVTGTGTNPKWETNNYTTPVNITSLSNGDQSSATLYLEADTAGVGVAKPALMNSMHRRRRLG